MRGTVKGDLVPLAELDQLRNLPQIKKVIAPSPPPTLQKKKKKELLY